MAPRPAFEAPRAPLPRPRPALQVVEDALERERRRLANRREYPISTEHPSDLASVAVNLARIEGGVEVLEIVRDILLAQQRTE